MASSLVLDVMVAVNTAIAKEEKYTYLGLLYHE
jgi:hypothetical protein